MRYLILLLISLFDCSDKDDHMSSTYPLLQGRYTDPNAYYHYWEFDDSNIALHKYEEGNFFPVSSMQWKIEKGRFHTRLWGTESDWRDFSFSLSGDTLMLKDTIYIRL